MARVYPLGQLVRNSAEVFQLKFAQEAAGELARCEALGVRASAEGLWILASTEQDLHEGIALLRERYGDTLAAGKPQVQYIWEPEPMEPFMELTISVPFRQINIVRSNLLARRGTILQSDSNHLYWTFLAEAPLAELLGYAQELRWMTDGRAKEEIRFKEYRPIGPGGTAA